MKLFSVRGRAELSIDVDEIQKYLESKKPLKRIILPQDSNELDTGGDSKEEKIGQKASLDRALYIAERNKKIQFGDKQAIAEYITEQTARNEEIKNRVEQSRLDWELDQEEKARLAKEAKITPQDRELEKLDIEKLERKRDKQLNNIRDYFNSSQEFWEKYQNNRHTAIESPAGALIIQADNGTWACDIHRYQQVLESSDGRLYASSYTIDRVEQHFRQDPKPHLDALIEIVNTKFDKLIEARKERTLEDKEAAFKREIRQIESIKTRTDGDMSSAARKITKGDKARIRREEEAQNEENRRIYRGLY